MVRQAVNQHETLFEVATEGDSPVGRKHQQWPSRYTRYRPIISHSNRFTVGLLQYAPQLRPPEGNVRYIGECLADLTDATIVLPECFLTSYRPRNIIDQSALAALLDPLRELSASRNLNLVGSLYVTRAQQAVNNVVLIERGAVHLSDQAKARLFGDENAALSPGAPAGKTQVGGLPATIQICLDIVDPLPVRQAVNDGARVVLAPSTVSVNFLKTIHKARALENQAIGVFCNRTGKDLDGTVYLGRSAIVFPDGTELSAPAADDQLLTAHIDLDHVRGFEQKFGAQ
jgi:predicted amidohydrolase